ncbi:MAG: hypothetical protein K6E55_10755 [Thermoguttaceae bacterium]|nr:hypothetical protein [Thermoguttaceae bacterium]
MRTVNCTYCELTAERWKLCRCGARVALCRHPARQYPHTPPLDHAAFHSERAAGENGEIVTEYTRVNSLYCTRRTCRNYEEGPE